MDIQSNRVPDLIGATVAVTYNLLIIALFILRIAGRMQGAHWVGLISLGAFFPLAYLLVVGWSANRPTIYSIWLGLMLFFLVVELFLDYILHIEFRTVRWAAITYVMLFCAATGGMIGVASQAGKGWAGAAIFTFLVMVIMAFVQRLKTGM